MKAWGAGALLVLGFLAGAAIVRRSKPPIPIPTIVTVYDTVPDTLELPPRRIVTTDTVQLVIRETVYETTYVNVGCVPEERTPIWPVLSVQAGRFRGDTTVATTFSLRTGQGAVSRIWTPGPIRSVWVDSSATPRFEFGEFPAPHRTSTLTKVLWASVGFGACRLTRGL